MNSPNRWRKSVPRRQSLRLLGAALAGAVLSPLGGHRLGRQARTPARPFAITAPTRRRNQCLAACQACNGNTSRLGGSCGKLHLLFHRGLQRRMQRPAIQPELRGLRQRLPRLWRDVLRQVLRRSGKRLRQLRQLRLPLPDPGPYEFGECIAGAVSMLASKAL